MPTTAKPKLYNPRHPERTLLYQTVAEHYETWLELASAGQFDGQCDHHTPKPFVCAFAKYWNAASLLTALRAYVAVTVGTTTSSLSPAKAGESALMHHTTRCVERRRYCTDHVFPTAKGAPVGAVPNRSDCSDQRGAADDGVVSQ
jgi:hypothetical protein